MTVTTVISMLHPHRIREPAAKKAGSAWHGSALWNDSRALDQTLSRRTSLGSFSSRSAINFACPRSFAGVHSATRPEPQVAV